jgi:hypothetical protein
MTLEKKMPRQSQNLGKSRFLTLIAHKALKIIGSPNVLLLILCVCTELDIYFKKKYIINV